MKNTSIATICALFLIILCFGVLYINTTPRNKGMTKANLLASRQLMLKINSIEMVKDYLKSPSTATFPNGLSNNDWNCDFVTGTENQEYSVSSWVEYQDSSGEMIRKEWKIVWLENELNLDKPSPKLVVLDGKIVFD